MKLLKDILAALFPVACFGFACWALTGCAATPNNNGAVRAANGEIRAINTQTRDDATGIEDDATKLFAFVSEKGKPLLEDMARRAASIIDGSKRSDAATMQGDKASDAQAADGAKKDLKIQKYKDSWGIELEHAVEWIAGGLAAVGIGLFIFRLVTEGTFAGAGAAVIDDIKWVFGRPKAVANQFMANGAAQ